MAQPRIYLSPPHLSGDERKYIDEAIDSNWIAPLGPQVDQFEREMCKRVGADYGVALASGSAALHLSLLLAGVGRGDEVFVPSLTFAASAFPAVYLGARPVFIDSETRSWNLDPDLVAETLAKRARVGQLPKVVVVVHLYGQCANLDPLVETCREYGVTMIEDAAEALGAAYRGRSPGTFGHSGVFSFNGNKIITTSGGGMLVSNDPGVIAHARKLATQARDPAAHYEHSEIGYNYRMSNVLAALGRAQLAVLEERVQARRENFAFYQKALGDLPGIGFMPEADWGRHNRWLTVVTFDPEQFGADREAVRLALEADNIEARPLWKPMHMQPVFASCEMVGGAVAERLFRDGLCLPSGSAMTATDRERVASVVRESCRHASR